MRTWTKRIISLLLAVSMVFGLAQVNPLPVQAAEKETDLGKAHGIIWLTKNAAGDSVSDEFTKMIQSQMKLDDMVCEALGAPEGTKVYFDGVNVGDAMDLFMNMDKVEDMVEEMKAAVSSNELIEFNIGSANGDKKLIAFRNLKSEGLKISVNEDNVIYVDHPGVPASAGDLEDMIDDALNNANITVDHTGKIVVKGFNTKNVARFEASGFLSEGGASYRSLLKKWPAAPASEENTKKAGEVAITIKAAEYSQYPESKFTKTVVFDVVMRDQRVTVDAAAEDPSTGALVQDTELSAYSAVLSGNKDVAPKETPVLKNYVFVKWHKVDDNHYTAIMKPKTDKNGNGLADQGEELGVYTVTYYVEDELFATETVNEGALPIGPEDKPVSVDPAKEFAGWETADGVEWPAKITADTKYYAVWKDVADDGEFVVTGTMVSEGQEGAALELEASCTDTTLKKYKVEDPGWDVLLSSGYTWTGWYFKASDYPEMVGDSNNVRDLNLDGDADEVRFYMIGDENPTEWDGDTYPELELYCEFMPVVEVNKPVTEWTEDSKTESVPVVGSTIVYNYSIETAAGTKYVTCVDKPEAFNAETYGVYYDQDHVDRLKIFEKWNDPVHESGNDYTIEAVTTDVKNEVHIEDGTHASAALGKMEDEIVTYTVDKDGSKYISTVEFDYASGDSESTHTYAVDAKTEIMVTPFRGDAGDILFSVEGLKAVVAGQTIENFTIRYDEQYNAYIEGVYDTIKAKLGDSCPEQLNGVKLYLQYDLKSFVEDTTAEVAAGKTDYTEEEIYELVIDKELNFDFQPDYDSDKVKVLYKAQENSYNVSLQKLYELFENDGLGVLKKVLEKAIKKISDRDDGTLEVTASESATWWRVGEGTSAYSARSGEAAVLSAQEVVDQYLIQKYQAFNDSTDKDITKFVTEIMMELQDVVYSRPHRTFGSFDFNETKTKEAVEVIYKSPSYGNSVKTDVAIDDDREATTITVKNPSITCTYKDSVTSKILANVDSNVDKASLVTYDTKYNVIRDFSEAGADTYKVKVAFKGDENNKPAISEEFTLEIKPVEGTKVTVEEVVEIHGAEDYAKVVAKVNNGAPIIQITAGIANDELAYGLNTEGNITDWSLEFKDNNLMAEAWVKLPQSYIDLLSSLELSTLKPFIEDQVGNVDIPSGKIVEGKYYKVEDIEKALEEKGYADDVANVEQVKQLQAIIDQIPDRVLSGLGISDLTYGVVVRFDAIGKDVYPTKPGVYANYAATLSTFNNFKGTGVEFDRNYSKSENYGFIVITEMVPIPNSGGVQLFGDGIISNAQNVFVYEYNGTDVVRDLEVAVDGDKLEGKTPFYYGISTRMDATKAAPTKPGVYFAGYNHTKTVYNEDSKQDEIKRLGSDSAIIIIKQREADLTITGGIYEYEEAAGKPVNKIAEVKITDKYGAEIIDKGVTVISGTVTVNDDGTNVSANDLRGTVNVDLADNLQDKWSEFCARKGYDSDEKLQPSDFITFLEECRDAAVSATETALNGFKSLAMKDAVSSALDKINEKQSYVDVSTGNLVNKANRVQNLLDNGVAYYNKLIDQMEVLKSVDDNARLTFYDLKTQSDKLEYGKTGYYLYMGMITDPDLTVGVAKGLVVIHSADDYVMYDTHVPYDGKAHGIEFDDNTCRDDVSVMVDRQANEITFFLDGDVYKAVNEALKKVPKLDTSLNEGSDVNVSTIYTMTEKVIDNVTKAIVDEIEATLIAKIKAKYPAGSEKLTNALNKVPGKVSNITERVTSKLEELDKLPNDTRIIFYNKDKATAEQGLPVDAGTYEFYGYDYDVSVTRGKLVIEPIYILVEDGIDPVTGEEIVVTKYDNEDDPDLRKYVSVTYHSFAGVAPAATSQLEVNLPTGVKEADVVEYVVTRTEANNRVVGTYDMSVTATLKGDSRNYKLAERTEDVQDFKVVAEVGTITRGEWRMELDSVVYLNYYPTLNDFSENFDFADKSRAGVVIWTGDKAPTNGKYVVVDGENTMKIEGWMQNSKGEWYVQTPEIYAKNLGDMWYIRPYVVDKDGEYVYLNGVEYYSPKYFAYDVMNEADRAEDEKYVCASLLQYGASAQIHFGYHDDKDNPLVNIIPARDINGRKYTNVSWDDYDLEYNEAYEDKIVITPDIIDLAGTLAIDEYYAKGITYNKSALDLAGAIRLSVGFEIDTTTIDPTQIKKQEVLFWNERDFENADTLAYSAATYNYKCDLVKATGNEEVNLGSYRGKSDHIVAKYLGEAVFFTCRIEMNDGTVYNSGLWYYSPEEFAADHIDESTGTVVDVSKRIIVYSEMAERCFIKNKK